MKCLSTDGWGFRLGEITDNRPDQLQTTSRDSHQLLLLQSGKFRCSLTKPQSTFSNLADGASCAAGVEQLGGGQTGNSLLAAKADGRLSKQESTAEERRT